MFRKIKERIKEEKGMEEYRQKCREFAQFSQWVKEEGIIPNVEQIVREEIKEEKSIFNPHNCVLLIKHNDYVILINLIYGHTSSWSHYSIHSQNLLSFRFQTRIALRIVPTKIMGMFEKLPNLSFSKQNSILIYEYPIQTTRINFNININETEFKRLIQQGCMSELDKHLTPLWDLINFWIK